MKLVVFTRYDDLGASSRVRYYNMVKYMEEGFGEVIFHPLINNQQLNRLYNNKRYLPHVLIFTYFKRLTQLILLDSQAVLLIEKELFPNIPAFIELFLLRKRIYVVDYDDSIFHNYDLHPNKIIRKVLGSKIDLLMKEAKLVWCGSHYLLQRAIASNARYVQLLPTIVNTNKYRPSQRVSKNASPIIVWIGTPQTVKYLKLVAPALNLLAIEHSFILRIVGATNIDIAGVNIEFVKWSIEKEVEAIATADIGIMPLENTPWEKGKCGYKLIQYMACGLPVVGSAIGENNYIIDESCGYAVLNDDEWYHSLKSLILNDDLRKKMGENGRQKVVEYYSETVAGSIIGSLRNKL
jgi:glycosyltransferase involved in cell wall biosynthesis